MFITLRIINRESNQLPLGSRACGLPTSPNLKIWLVQRQRKSSALFSQTFFFRSAVVVIVHFVFREMGFSHKFEDRENWRYAAAARKAMHASSYVFPMT